MIPVNTTSPPAQNRVQSGLQLCPILNNLCKYAAHASFLSYAAKNATHVFEGVFSGRTSVTKIAVLSSLNTPAPFREDDRLTYCPTQVRKETEISKMI